VNTVFILIKETYHVYQIKVLMPFIITS